MRRMLLTLLAVVVCSGQMCSSSSSFDGSGTKNVCGRNYFNSAYRVGIELPAGIGALRAGSYLSGTALHVGWDWDVTDPPVEFSLVVFEAMAETTIEEFRESWLAAFSAAGQFNIMAEKFITLDDGGKGWYLAVSPKAEAGVNVEYVMTVTQEQLVYASAVYAPELVSDAQADEIGAVLYSLCADLI